MCRKCTTRNVVMISSLAALASTLANTASTLYHINAHDEQKLVLKRLAEVLSLGPDELIVNEAGELEINEQATTGEAGETAPEGDGFPEVLDRLLASLRAGRPAPEAPKEASAEDGVRVSEDDADLPPELKALIAKLKSDPLGSLVDVQIHQFKR